MTLFDDRERAFEKKFGLDQEAAFRVAVRRDKLLGQWAAREMGLEGDEAAAYGKMVVEAALEHKDVAALLLAEFQARSLDVGEAAIRRRMETLHDEARQQVLAELKAKQPL